MGDLLEQDPSASSFLAVDSHVGASGGVTTLRIAEEQVESAMSVEMYMDAVTARFPDLMKVIARDTVTLPSGRAGHLQTRVQVNNITAEQVGYFIKCGDTIYSARPLRAQHDRGAFDRSKPRIGDGSCPAGSPGTTTGRTHALATERVAQPATQESGGVSRE